MDMERAKKGWKKALRKAFCLPPIPTLLISVPSYALVIYALAGEDVEAIITYAAYFLSAYSLIITVTGITGVVRFVQRGIHRHPLVRNRGKGHQPDGGAGVHALSGDCHADPVRRC